MADNKADTCYIQPIHPNIHLTVTSAKMLPLVILMRALTPTENDLIVATLCSQSHDLTCPDFLHVVREEKKNDEKNPL